MYGVTEQMNLIHLTKMPEQSVTITNCHFENNIAFDGNVLVDELAYLEVRDSRFKLNQSYMSANAIAAYSVTQALLDGNEFFENFGWQHTAGGAVTVGMSDVVHVSNNKFDSNMAGRKGNALSLVLNLQVTVDGNEFLNNGPSLAYSEQRLETPYFFYLLDKSRLSVFYASDGECTNEFEYFDACYDSSETVDIGGSEGAVYVEASDDFSTDSSDVQILNNYFYNNQATPVIHPAQKA